MSGRGGGYLGAIDIPHEVSGPVRLAFDSIRGVLEKLEVRGRSQEIHEPFYVDLTADGGGLFLGYFPVLRPDRDIEITSAYWTPMASSAAIYSLALDRWGADGGTPMVRLMHIDGALATTAAFVARAPYLFPVMTRTTQRIKRGDVLTLRVAKTDDVGGGFPRGLLSLYWREVG